MASLLYHGEYTALWSSPQRLLLGGELAWAEPLAPPSKAERQVTIENFREYLAQMAELMQRFEAINPTALGGTTGSAPGEGEADTVGAADRPSGDGADQPADGVGRDSGEAAGGAGFPGVGAGTVTRGDLETVPGLYFEKDFRLDDLATFEQTGASSDDPATARALQETLSEHLGAVEHVLLREIQARSQAFYAALDTLHRLHAQVDTTVETIRELRAGMQALDQRLVGHALRIAQLRRRRRNVEKMHRALTLIAGVKQTQQNLQVLMSCSDFVSALDLILETKAVIGSELAGVAAVQDTAAQLTEMQGVVLDMMRSEFVGLALGRDSLVQDTSQACGELSIVSVLDGPGAGAGGGGGDPASLVAVEDRLLALTLALVRAGKLAGAVEELKTAAVNEVLLGIKGVLRRELPPAPVGGGGAGGGEEKTPLAVRLRALGKEEFLGLMRRMFRVLTLILGRCANVHCKCTA